MLFIFLSVWSLYMAEFGGGFVKLINVNCVMNYFKESVDWCTQWRGSIPFNVQEEIMLIFGTILWSLGLCKSLSGTALKISCSWQLKQLKMTWYYIIHDATLIPVWTNFHSISDFQFYTKQCNLFFLVTLLWPCTSNRILLIFILLSHTTFYG